MQVKQVNMTPKMAADLLKRNTRNRPPNRRHVKHLARLMKEGKWMENGDTICINGKHLVDGQHRLEAICESGKAIKCIVVSDLPSDAFLTKDTGARRGGGTMLQISGYSHAKSLASAVMYVDSYIRTQSFANSGADTRISPAESVAFVKKHPGIQHSVARPTEQFRLMPRSIVGALHYLFQQRDPDAADKFIDDLITGSGVLMSDPVHLLRERLISNLGNVAKLPRTTIAALAIKAWNARRNGEEMKQLKYVSTGDKPETFPKIV